MKRIELTRGQYALVDDEDYEELSNYKWAARKAYNTYYAVRYIKRSRNKQISMHRHILELWDSKLSVDHKDRNGLNNQRENIRACTNSENQKNRTASGRSKYLGVHIIDYQRKYFSTKNNKYTYHHKTGIVARIVVDKKPKHLGSFKTELEAAIVYNIAARKYHGKFANPNIFR